MEEEPDDNVQDAQEEKINYNKQWKVCLVGDMGVGKSSLLTRIKDSTFCINALTTTGAIFASVYVTVDNQVHKFIVWDTPGQERFRFFAPVYYRGIRAAILVYSVVDRRTYRSVTEHWFASVKNHLPSDGRKIVLCLVGNKADMEKEREVTREEAESFAAENNVLYAETSAFTGDNVIKLFEDLARRVTTELDEELKRKTTSTKSADVTDSNEEARKQQAANDIADDSKQGQ